MVFVCVSCARVVPQCWSRDGYGLWMAPHSGGREKSGTKKGCAVYLLNFLKNAIVNNPTVVSSTGLPHSAALLSRLCSPQTNHHHIMLQGPDRLHLLVSNSLIANGNRGRTQEIGSVIASTPHWRILQVTMAIAVRRILLLSFLCIRFQRVIWA